MTDTPRHPHRRAALRTLAAACVAEGRPAVLVQVSRVRGSTPRETGARMLVSLDELQGTIGGGHLEWQAVGLARQALRESLDAAAAGAGRGEAFSPWTQSFALGPTLGQCCGGAVDLWFEPLTAEVLMRWPAPQPRFHLDLHGAGHVGQALVRLLTDLDCEVRWIDQRWDGEDGPPPGDRAAPGLPKASELAALPVHVRYLPTDDAVAEVPQAPPGAAHLVLTHRHDLDLALVDRILRRNDVREGHAWVGMIGSATKRAAFERRLRERGHADDVIARLACPIGVPGIVGKEPAVIAVAAVAQLLQRHPPAAD